MFTSSQPPATATLTPRMQLEVRIAYTAEKLAAARLAGDQDLICEYGDTLEYLGDLFAECN